MAKKIEALSKVYEHVDDVDYYVAGLLEKSKPGSMLGHTFQCVVGEMFFRLKYGDRFYYEFGHQMGSFKLGNLYSYNMAIRNYYYYSLYYNTIVIYFMILFFTNL